MVDAINLGGIVLEAAVDGHVAVQHLGHAGDVVEVAQRFDQSAAAPGCPGCICGPPFARSGKRNCCCWRPWSGWWPGFHPGCGWRHRFRGSVLMKKPSKPLVVACVTMKQPDAEHDAGEAHQHGAFLGREETKRDLQVGRHGGKARRADYGTTGVVRTRSPSRKRSSSSAMTSSPSSTPLVISASLRPT